MHPAPTDPTRASARVPTLREGAIVVAAFTAVFGWLYARPFLDGTFLAESDLYEYYLPIFLSPITTWSHFEFGGLPAFADPGDFTAYPPHFIFARLIGSWTALSVSAFVLAASFTYAYVRFLTGSRRAAAFAGLAYGLSEALMERLPHSGTLHAAAWLPLILLAIEHLHGDSWRRWLAVGSLAAGSCSLAGHPQPAIYIYYCCGLYALAGGLAARAPLRYYARVAGLFALGAALTMIKGLPFIEASFYMAREEVNFGQFTSHANTPSQMLSLLYPTILHEGREAPTYVGLITLVLALVGMRQGWKTSWRIPFWVGLTLFAVLLGMGDSTPVAGVAYYIPLYWKFRVAARHLILAAFGLCVLAGVAVAAIERGVPSRRLVRLAAGLLVAAMAATCGVMYGAPAAFAFEARAPLPWTLPAWNAGVWVQAAIGAVTAALALGASRAGRRRSWLAAIAALLVADTLYSLPYRVTPWGLDAITIPAAATRPSVHAIRLGEAVAPLHQRVLAPGGTHRDAVLPAAWARLWQIPIAGGYGPMLLETHSQLAQMGTNGSVSTSVLASDDVALDVLAVRRIVMRADDMAAPATFERNGLSWSVPMLDLTAGRADCNHAYPRTLSLPLPPDIDIAEVALVGHLRCSEDAATGTEVARVEMRQGARTVYGTSLHAGVEIADRALADTSVAARAGHTPAVIFPDPDATPYEYLVRVRPPAAARADRLVLEVPAMPGWLAIDRMTIVDGAGQSHPVSQTDLFLGHAGRWVETERFATSRTTDRDRDDHIDGETAFVVFDNRRARPRAWMASETLPLERSDLIEAIRHSQLPDGRVFDPAVTALLGDSGGATARQFGTGVSTVTIETLRDGHVTIDVQSNGGFLVFSEAFYPGWRARVDGQDTPVERTDLSLLGVAVPAGRHRVEFVFMSRTLLAGTVTSGLGLVVCAVLLAGPRRRRARPGANHAPVT